ncbi:MAG: ATP-binding protein [Phycisphaerae bacterium]|nr:ATP-binding protein [Phycisphaerae bacterium]
MREHSAGEALRVRELCRQLKPVIGARADRIWMAYVIEDKDGKAQILDYLEVLAAQHFQGTLENEGPGLLPPSTEAARGEYELGTVTYNGRDLHPLGLRESEWIQHVGVFGRSGAGKTNLGFLVVQELVKAGKPVLILDWKRNYRDLLTLPGFENTAVYTIGRAVSPLSFNPLIPPPGTSPQTWLKKVIAVLGHSYLLGDGVAYLLQEAIDRAFEEAGVYTGSVDRWPTFKEVLEILKRRQVSGREAGWMSSALRALASLCFGEMDTLVNQGHDDIRSLLSRPVILELDALTQPDKVFVASTLVLYIHHLRMTEPVRETLKSVLLIEEAHHILSGERQSLAGGQSVMDIAFREIREFGTGIVLLDQMPSTITASALANTYAVLCFNLKHRADVSAISQAMLLEDQEKDILGRLQVGEAVVRLQGRGVRPFMIHVPEFAIHKGSISDAQVMVHMRQLGLLSDRRRAVLRTVSVANVADSLQEPATDPEWPTHSLPEAAFLADVAAFPDSGIAERYRRLGLSVRQGQRIKDAGIEKGLISEEIHTTRMGKIRVVRLTDQGRLLVDHPDSRPEAA